MRGPTETVAKFGRRFKRAVHLAYPLAPNAARDPMGRRFLRHRYLQALNHPDLMGRILREGRPDTFEQAMDLAARYEADELNVLAQSKQCSTPQYGPQYERVEEPMDVNHLAQDNSEVNAYDGARPKRAIRGQQFPNQSNQPKSSMEHAAPIPSSYDQNKAIANIQRQVDGLAKQFTALMADRRSESQHQQSQHKNRQPPSSNRRDKTKFFPDQLEYTMDGRPICLYCKIPGHFKRDCRKKAAADSRRFQGGQ